MAYDLHEYDAVDDRTRAFRKRFPTGSIRTELVRHDPDIVVFKALVFRDPRDPHPTTGWAYDRPTAAERAAPGAPAYLQRCETLAVGRALANLDFAGRRRPSREEMEKVRRLAPERRRVRRRSPHRTG